MLLSPFWRSKFAVEFFSLSPKLLRRIEERIEEHVSIPEILKRYGLPALFFHFLVWVSTLTACYLFLSLNTSILELLPAELQQRISACLTDMHAVLESCEVFMPMKQLNILSKTIQLAPKCKVKPPKKNEPSLTRQRWWKSDWLCSSCFRCSWSSWPSPSGVDRSSSTQRISSGTTIWMVPANRGWNCTLVWPFQSWKLILNSLW